MKQVKRNGRIYNLVLASAQANKYTKWADKVGIEQKGLKVKLPTKDGIKEYDGVKLKNGKTAVYIMNGKVLKYAWA